MQIKRRRRNFQPKKVEKRTRINEWIRIPEVFLIDENGDNVGVISTEKARQMAKDANLDLVEVNPKARPSVCKIMDYGKIKYEQQKQAHKQKVAQKKTEVKGIRLSFKIKGNDLETRIKQAEKFLKAGHSVKIELILKGREKAYRYDAIQIVNGFVKSINDNSEEEIKIITPVKTMGGKIFVVIGK
jgi:translation initiation factor IF-3